MLNGYVHLTSIGLAMQICVDSNPREILMMTRYFWEHKECYIADSESFRVELLSVKKLHLKLSCANLVAISVAGEMI